AWSTSPSAPGWMTRIARSRRVTRAPRHSPDPSLVTVRRTAASAARLGASAAPSSPREAEPRDTTNAHRFTPYVAYKRFNHPRIVKLAHKAVVDDVHKCDAAYCDIVKGDDSLHFAKRLLRKVGLADHRFSGERHAQRP